MKKTIYPVLGIIAVVIIGLALAVPDNANAQAAPKAFSYPFEVGIVSSTADQDILTAPGADYHWVITGLGYNVLVEEADATVDVEDKAGTPVEICEFAPETQGMGMYYDFGQGIVCSQNSGVTVDLSGSTADVYIYVNAYKERSF